MAIRSFERLSGAEELYPQLRTELGLSPTSAPLTPDRIIYQNSMAKASQIDDATPSRPRLAAPIVWESRGSLVRQMIGAQEYGAQITQELVEVAKTSFQKECEKYKSFTHEAIEAYMQFKDSETNASGWSYFRRAISFIGSAISLGVGSVALSAGGGPWAVALMVAGGANIGNEIMRVTDGWEKVAGFFTSDKEKVAKIATGLQISAGAVSALTGIMAAFGTANVLQLANITETTTLIATTAGNMAAGVASIGEGYATSKALAAKNTQIQTQAKATEHKAEVHKIGDEIKDAAKANERSIAATADMLESYKAQIDMIQSLAAGAA